MTVRTVALTDPADYTLQATAIAASSNGDEISTTEAGVYGPQVIDASALTNITLDDTVGGLYTIRLDTSSFYAFKLGDVLAMIGGTIRGAANRAIYASGAIAASFVGVDMYVDSGGGQAMLWADNAAHVSFTCLGVTGDTQTTPEIFATFSGARVDLDGVHVADNITLSLGVLYVYSGVASSIIMRGVGSDNTAALLLVRAGATITSLTVEGCYADHIVINDGTITAGTYAHNVYNTTDVGTTGTGDVSGVTDFEIDAEGVPDEGSVLTTVIPVGTRYGSGSTDSRGKPRWSGGNQHVGSKQRQRRTRTAGVRRSGGSRAGGVRNARYG